MKFNEFTETVRDGLAVLFEPDNMEVAVTRVVKNNGLILTGINIRDRNSMITPTIYIDDFYREDIQKEENTYCCFEDKGYLYGTMYQGIIRQ